MAQDVNALPPGAVIGILGGGQLGRMLSLAAARLGLKTHIYSPDLPCPASEVAHMTTQGAYEDAEKLTEFAKQCDVVTYEFENVPAATARIIGETAPLRPNSKALEVAQDRWVEKTFISQVVKTKVAGFSKIDSLEDLQTALAEHGTPAVLKTRRFGYDGKGQIIIRDLADAQSAWEGLGKTDLILEAFIPFKREVSVIAARGLNGDCCAYPLIENVHQNHILHTSVSPAPNDSGAAQAIAIRILEKLDYFGVMGTEFFELEDGDLIVNEIAPRVHNSGHWTQDAGCTDQFEQHIRAVAGWPLGVSPPLHSVEMTNLIGDDVSNIHALAQEKDTYIHLYGKAEARAGRKMGHVNRILKSGDA